MLVAVLLTSSAIAASVVASEEHSDFSDAYSDALAPSGLTNAEEFGIGQEPGPHHDPLDPVIERIVGAAEELDGYASAEMDYPSRTLHLRFSEDPAVDFTELADGRVEVVVEEVVIDQAMLNAASEALVSVAEEQDVHMTIQPDTGGQVLHVDLYGDADTEAFENATDVPLEIRTFPERDFTQDDFLRHG